MAGDEKLVQSQEDRGRKKSAGKFETPIFFLFLHLRQIKSMPGRPCKFELVVHVLYGARLGKVSSCVCSLEISE